MAVEEPEAPAAPTVVIADEVTASSVSMGNEVLSVDFPDKEIRNILRNVADLFELNLVIPDTWPGNTSIKLRDVATDFRGRAFSCGLPFRRGRKHHQGRESGVLVTGTDDHRRICNQLRSGV
ncbi:MAG: hypothetical protein J6386_08935 [Candidatus Synoicihabitans palmerolidicus]|nr:hypothetical protein [Candidatus Synoicihabitans palmerolidicus]